MLKAMSHLPKLSLWNSLGILVSIHFAHCQSFEGKIYSYEVSSIESLEGHLVQSIDGLEETESKLPYPMDYSKESSSRDSSSVSEEMDRKRGYKSRRHRGKLGSKCESDSDCVDEAHCILGWCDTPGRGGNICVKHSHCR